PSGVSRPDSARCAAQPQPARWGVLLQQFQQAEGRTQRALARECDLAAKDPISRSLMEDWLAARTGNSHGAHMKSILDPTFHYVPSVETDLKQTLARI